MPRSACCFCCVHLRGVCLIAWLCCGLHFAGRAACCCSVSVAPGSPVQGVHQRRVSSLQLVPPPAFVLTNRRTGVLAVQPACMPALRACLRVHARAQLDFHLRAAQCASPPFFTPHCSEYWVSQWELPDRAIIRKEAVLAPYNTARVGMQVRFCVRPCVPPVCMAPAVSRMRLFCLARCYPSLNSSVVERLSCNRPVCLGEQEVPSAILG